MANYRQVGGELGAFIRANNPSTQQIQALLRDLLAGDELLNTMRDVVSSASFQNLQSLAGSGQGAIQRDALLNELSRRYLPSVIDGVSQLLNGMLDQPAASTIFSPDLPNNSYKTNSRLKQDNAKEKTSKTGGENHDEIHRFISTDDEPSNVLSRKLQRPDASDKARENQITYGSAWAGIFGALGVIIFSMALVNISKQEKTKSSDTENTINCERVLADIQAASLEQKIRIYKEHSWQCTGDEIKAAAGL